MARITTAKARKAYTCSKCGADIKPGTEYRHATPGFRGTKIIRCLGGGCYFRQSELCTSNLQGAYAAQEAAEDAIDEATTLDDIQSIFNDYAEGLREVAEVYSDASSNWAEGRGNEEWDEKADALNSAADEAEGFEWDRDECETCSGSEVDPDENIPEGEERPCPDCCGEDGVALGDDRPFTEDDLTSLREAAQEFLGGIEWEV